MTLSVWVAALAGVIAFLAICLLVPVRMTRAVQFPSPKFEAEDNSRKTVAQILGGAALILTFAWSFLKDSETLEQSREQIANDQYLNAAKLLGENTASSRCAAAFSMAALSSTRVEYTQPVIDTLVALLREHTPNAVSGVPQPIGVDDACIVTALGKRTVGAEAIRISMPSYYLVRGSFFGASGFEGADLDGTKLWGADLRYANLAGASFRGAQMDDWKAYGPAWSDAISKQADWKEWLKYRYIANFEGAKLSKANFEGAGLAGANFKGADLEGANLAGAQLSRAIFSGANLAGTTFCSGSDGARKCACADDPPIFDSGLPTEIGKCSKQ